MQTIDSLTQRGSALNKAFVHNITCAPLKPLLIDIASLMYHFLFLLTARIVFQRPAWVLSTLCVTLISATWKFMIKVTSATNPTQHNRKPSNGTIESSFFVVVEAVPGQQTGNAVITQSHNALIHYVNVIYTKQVLSAIALARTLQSRFKRIQFSAHDHTVLLLFHSKHLLCHWNHIGRVQPTTLHHILCRSVFT